MQKKSRRRRTETVGCRVGEETKIRRRGKTAGIGARARETREAKTGAAEEGGGGEGEAGATSSRAGASCTPAAAGEDEEGAGEGGPAGADEEGGGEEESRGTRETETRFFSDTHTCTHTCTHRTFLGMVHLRHGIISRLLGSNQGGGLSTK